MKFEQIIGQDKVKNGLRQLVNGGRMPHALLFLGPKGCGKLALAIAFAQYILCESKTDEDACGVCRSCSKISKLIHPDLHFSYPTIGTKITSDTFLTQWRSALSQNPYLDANDWLQIIGAENKQGNINKEECVNIIKRLSLKIFEGSHKVLILWLPEYLGKEGNRLLKIIEEPPPNTLFLLVAENQELILNTILSRCQLVKVPPLSDQDIVTSLAQSGKVSEAVAKTIAHLSNGNFNTALQLTEHRENDNATLFLEWMRKCYKGNGVELVKWVEKFAGIGREYQKYFLQYGLHFLREYMVLKLTGQVNIRLQAEELKTAQNLTKVIELDQLEKIIKLFTDCAYHVERNANPKVLFLDASINLNKILKRKLSEDVLLMKSAG